MKGKVQNPFLIMHRWITFEILDLEAIVQAIDKSHEIYKQKLDIERFYISDMKNLDALKNNKVKIKSLLQCKNAVR